MIRFTAILLIATLTAIAQDASRLDVLVQTLGKIGSPAAQASILKGMRDSLQGQRGIPEPKGWPELYAKLKVSPDEHVRANAQALAAIFGSGAAMGEMRARFSDPANPVEERREALEALVAQHDTAALDSLLRFAVEAGPLREHVLRGLTAFDDPRIAPALIGAFQTYGTAERRAALQTLVSRAANAKAFVAALDAKKIARTELTASLARQLDGLQDAELSAWLKKNWGAVSAPNEDKQKLIAKFREFTGTEAVLRADASRGRALFAQTCAACHTLFGTGGHIGPELTGGYEDNEYLLLNILDPNAIIGKDYQQTFVKTKDGQTLAGIVTQETERAISLKTLSGEVTTVQRSDVASAELSPLSMMPEGLLLALAEEDVRDLFFYLRQKAQVPMLLTAINANDFFTGSDLRNWIPSGEAWTAENGEFKGKGAANAPVSIASEMVAGDYKLSAQVRITGDNAAAELVLTGERDAAGFIGINLGFGGPSPLALWDYRAATEPKAQPGKKALGDGQWHTVEAVRKAGRLSVAVDGTPEFDIEDPRHRRRVAPAFYLLGEGAEIQIKALKIEPL